MASRLTTLKSRLVIALLAFVCAAVGSPPARAVDPGEALGDARLEARARGLSAELRCLVCQNQSIDDSNAPLAKDLRRLVRERITAGESDDDVMRHIVDRYGEFVLLRPPLGIHTLLLWGTPLLVLLATGAAIALGRRGRDGVSADADRDPLTADEQRALDRLLKPVEPAAAVKAAKPTVSRGRTKRGASS